MPPVGVAVFPQLLRSFMSYRLGPEPSRSTWPHHHEPADAHGSVGRVMVPRPIRKLFIEDCQEVRRPRARLTAIGCGDSLARPRFRSSAQVVPPPRTRRSQRDHKSRLTASMAQLQGHPPTGRGAGGGQGRLSLHQPDAHVAPVQGRNAERCPNVGIVRPPQRHPHPPLAHGVVFRYKSIVGDGLRARSPDDWPFRRRSVRPPCGERFRLQWSGSCEAPGISHWKPEVTVGYSHTRRAR